VDWFAFSLWEHGELRRSLSLSSDDGVMEDVGAPLPFELPFWAGERPLEGDDTDDYPLPFHPLELAEAAQRYAFGFVTEGTMMDDDPEADALVLTGFSVQSVSPSASTPPSGAPKAPWWKFWN
ncbi:MAG: hypothetical protein R3F39_23425, partial [Myxococcota bacterium]